MQNKIKHTMNRLFGIMGFTALFFLFNFGTVAVANAAPTIEIWWPTQNAELHGVQPFKGLLQGSTLDQYDMYWQVGSGNLVIMNDNFQDYPHKEATVDLT